jgi:phosphatidate cytidylyltransferase
MTAVVYAGAVLIGLYFGGWVWLGLVMLAAGLAYRELASIGRAQVNWPGALVCAAGVGSAAIALPEAGLALAALFLALTLLRGGRSTPPFGAPFMLSWAFTAAGLLYIGGLLVHAVLLRNLPDGRNWLLISLVGVWTCDTGAYIVGSMWGRRKLAPRISPNKTWEGAISGFVTGAAVVVVLAQLFDVALIHALVLAVLVPIATILGDLAESALKRGTGTKDTGRLLPGHGGMLDRIDSLMVVLPVVYYYVTLVIR